MGKGDSFLQKTLKFLARLRPTLGVDAQSGLPTVSVDAAMANDTMGMTDVLNMVESYAREVKLCVIFDEFQAFSTWTMPIRFWRFCVGGSSS